MCIIGIILTYSAMFRVARRSLEAQVGAQEATTEVEAVSTSQTMPGIPITPRRSTELVLHITSGFGKTARNDARRLPWRCVTLMSRVEL